MFLHCNALFACSSLSMITTTILFREWLHASGSQQCENSDRTVECTFGHPPFPPSVHPESSAVEVRAATGVSAMPQPTAQYTIARPVLQQYTRRATEWVGRGGHGGDGAAVAGVWSVWRGSTRLRRPASRSLAHFGSRVTVYFVPQLTSTLRFSLSHEKKGKVKHGGRGGVLRGGRSVPAAAAAAAHSRRGGPVDHILPCMLAVWQSR